MSRVLHLWFVSITALAAFTPPAFAQTAGANAPGSAVVVAQPESAPPQAWGITGENVIVVGANALRPPSNTIGYNTFDSGTTGSGVYQTTNPGTVLDWWYLASVPTGAVITRLLVEACDTSAAGSLLFGLARYEVGGSFANVAPQVSTGTAAVPGCSFFAVTPPVPLTVNNDTQHYLYWAAWNNNFTSAVRFQSVRLYYKLQVSPAPATATFTDVPVGNPYHRFVEAVVAAGITGGCGGGNYCPDAPVSRAQMAVFLAVALGLYFPN